MQSLKQLYKIGRGPSSSHTMGPEKACLRIKQEFSQADLFKITLYGSLALTGKGHGTDRIIKETFAPIKCEIIFDKKSPCDIHPNTMDVEAYKNNELIGKRRVYSVGGGSILFENEESETPNDVYSLNSFTEISQYCLKHNIRIWEYVRECEGEEIFEQHLWITCFLYGLLRPMDAVVPYRMEHCVRLEATDERPVNQFWKDKLTDVLIESVKADDGVLIHLSTEEYEHLFDWRKVKQEVKVVQPLFYVRTSKGLKMQAVWAKSCRGAMVRFILQNRLLVPEELHAFSYEGFEYQPQLGEEAFPHFVRG